MADQVLQLAKKPAEADTDIVGLCKSLLRMAEAGEIRGISVAIDPFEGLPKSAVEFTDGLRCDHLLAALCVARRKVEDIVIALEQVEGY